MTKVDLGVKCDKLQNTIDDNTRKDNTQERVMRAHIDSSIRMVRDHVDKRNKTVEAKLDKLISLLNPNEY